MVQRIIVEVIPVPESNNISSDQIEQEILEESCESARDKKSFIFWAAIILGL